MAAAANGMLHPCQILIRGAYEPDPYRARLSRRRHPRAQQRGALADGVAGIRAELARSAATPDLVAGVQMAWYFGGMAMLVFGVIVVALFRAAQQGRGVPVAVVAAIGCGYLAFGAIEFIITGYQPFTVIFMLPAALLLAASAPVRRLPAAP
jgi:hypothetical protein